MTKNTKRSWVPVSFILLVLATAHATAEEQQPIVVERSAAETNKIPAREARNFFPFIKAGTEFPVWTGADLGARIWKNFSFHVGYGKMLSSYAGFIGGRIDQFANKSGYDSVIKGITDSNHILRGGIDYHFSGRKGWSVGTTVSQLNADGKSSITDVETLTNTQFTTLKNLLSAAGKELVFTSDLSLTLLELHASYTFGLMNHLFLETSFGVSKVIANSVQLSSNAPNCDASNAGANLYNQAQNELDSVLKKYGYVPMLGLSLVYEF